MAGRHLCTFISIDILHSIHVNIHKNSTLPTIVIYTLALSSFGPSAIAIALESSPIGRKGMIMGRFYGAIGVGMIVGPLLTSLLTYYLEVQQIFLFALALPITGLTIFTLFGSKSLLKKSNEKKLTEEKGTRSLLYSI